MTIKFNQIGLAEGVYGQARSDGLANGALISITSSVSSSVTMLWRPDDETADLVAVNSTLWTITPTAGVYGSYMFYDQTTQNKRVFSIRTPNKSLRIPALAESAHPSASLINNTAFYKNLSAFNETSGSGPFSTGNYGGWYSAFRELVFTVDNLTSSAPVTGGEPNATYLVLNATSSLFNERVFTAGTGISVVDAGAGAAYTVSSYKADEQASYIVTAATASLPNERVFTAGTGITTADAGAGGAYTVGINNNVVATVSGTTFSGTVSGTLGKFSELTGSLTQLNNGLSYLAAGSGVTVVSQSNGQVVISSTGGSSTTQYMRVYMTGSASTSTGAIPFNAVDEDTASAWNNVTKQWTCPTTGLYLFIGYVAVNDFRNLSLQLYRNGISYRGMMGGAQAFSLTVSCTARMTASNTAYLHATVTGGSTWATGLTGVAFEIVGPL